MAKITDKELAALPDEFDTHSLFRVIDELDKMRGHLNDQDGHKPPEIRDDLLKLHGLAKHVVNESVAERAQAMFQLAFEIEDQLSDLAEALEIITNARFPIGGYAERINPRINAVMAGIAYKF